ncbi:hypothetical protein [Myxococcus eversor]|nr:hypothetical protein [Myxococcus eversor]
MNRAGGPEDMELVEVALPPPSPGEGRMLMKPSIGHLDGQAPGHPERRGG